MPLFHFSASCSRTECAQEVGQAELDLPTLADITTILEQVNAY